MLTRRSLFRYLFAGFLPKRKPKPEKKWTRTITTVTVVNNHESVLTQLKSLGEDVMRDKLVQMRYDLKG
jgi:hypothetical protein